MAHAFPNIKADRIHYSEAFRLDRNWIPPKPYRRTTKSTFGPQILSKRVTSPSIGFGTAGRSALDKMYLSAEMTKTKPGNFSPGPAYELASSFGRQPTSNCESPPFIKLVGRIDGSEENLMNSRDLELISNHLLLVTRSLAQISERLDSSAFQMVQSAKKSPERYVFARGTRDQREKIYLSVEFNKAKLGSQSPGPSVYGARTTFGPQSASRNRTAPVINFTKGLRDQIKYDPESAGPGQYKVKGSVGTQAESQRLTLPAFSFPHCSRARLDKVFLSKEHDKSHYGETSPGPGCFKQVSSMVIIPPGQCPQVYITDCVYREWSRRASGTDGDALLDFRQRVSQRRD